MRRKAVAILLAGMMAMGVLTSAAGAQETYPPPSPAPTPPPSGCADVPRNVYYTFPFDWAWQQRIIIGVGGSRFCEPLRDVTRAEAITILWRAVGRPAEATPHGFTDTTPGAFYEPALNWAKAEGHTTGYGGSDANPSTIYEPNLTVDRAELYTLLWRILGRPGGPPNTFTDTLPNAFYAPAVDWAQASGATTGYAGSNEFRPHLNVDRAQTVTATCRSFGPC
jgi:hypothetical protein